MTDLVDHEDLDAYQVLECLAAGFCIRCKRKWACDQDVDCIVRSAIEAARKYKPLNIEDGRWVMLGLGCHRHPRYGDIRKKKHGQWLWWPPNTAAANGPYTTLGAAKIAAEMGGPDEEEST